jgi:hypothetical protein
LLSGGPRHKQTKYILKLNGTHQLLVLADDADLLGDNICTEALIDARKDIGLEVNRKN